MFRSRKLFVRNETVLVQIFMLENLFNQFVFVQLLAAATSRLRNLTAQIAAHLRHKSRVNVRTTLIKA
jgi:hypothetical protein